MTTMIHTMMLRSTPHASAGSPRRKKRFTRTNETALTSQGHRTDNFQP